MATSSISYDQAQSQAQEEKSEYVDFGDVEFYMEENRDIQDILTIKHTTKDKLTYTIFSLNIFFTCFIVGYCPQYFYLWHTAKCLTLIPYRWYTYKQQRYHYFLFDFCYFTNFLLLLYFWLPDSLMAANIRGRLFTTCFSFANGPVLSAIVTWRNSLVPHSNDKMTSLFIHVSPAMSLYGIRWFSTPDQGFPICSHQRDMDPSSCSGTGLLEIIYYPMLMYCAWQLFYVLVVEIAFAKKVQKHDYATSYRYIVEKSQKSLMVQLFSMCGHRYRKVMFIVFQFFYTLAFIHLAYFSYVCKECGMLAVILVMTAASYNGACFYIDVFSHKYKKSLEKQK